MVMFARGNRQGASKFLATSLGIGWVGALALGCGGNPEDFAENAAAVGVTRSYFIAADEVVWDYAPSNGINLITGEPFDDQANVFVQPGPQRIGSKYWKALYREYTDGTFTH